MVMTVMTVMTMAKKMTMIILENVSHVSQGLLRLSCGPSLNDLSFFISLILSYLLPQQSECLILSLLTAIKGCLSEFGLFDEHFQVNRLLFKY